ncbi:MAG: RsmD family RNA methyltransferase [Holophagaceae bacterium]|nr:RsmD family RNA methyltransferase [Holophagaceae bacterium]
MRIIAGAYKGKRLASLDSKSNLIRPTSDMAREALFSILSGWPKGSFLDVFSGTGAVGIEALSRGYSPVWCIENNKNSLACIRANAKDTSLNILPMDAYKIKHGSLRDISVIFADPPYDKSVEMWGKLASTLSNYLSPDGVLVWECKQGTQLPEIPGIATIQERIYGSSKFIFFERADNRE